MNDPDETSWPSSLKYKLPFDPPTGSESSTVHQGQLTLKQQSLFFLLHGCRTFGVGVMVHTRRLCKPFLDAFPETLSLHSVVKGI